MNIQNPRILYMTDTVEYKTHINPAAHLIIMTYGQLPCTPSNDRKPNTIASERTFNAFFFFFIFRLIKVLTSYN